MNNTYSLTIFIPEFLLLLNIFIHFIYSDGRSRKFIILRNSFLFISLSICLILEILFRPDKSHGLFFNSFILNPFTMFFSLFLILLFLIFEYRNIRQNYTSFSNDILIQKLLYLTASILLIKANSLISLILCVGLIFLNNINYFCPQKSEKENYQFFLTSHLMIFVILLFGIMLYYGITGSFFFMADAAPGNVAKPNSVVFSFTALLLMIGFGLYGFILPFGKLFGKQPYSFDNGCVNSAFYIPLFAFWGITFRILNDLLSVPESELIVKNYRTFILLCSILLIVAASLYFPIRRKTSDLFHISLIIHRSLSILGFGVISLDVTAVSIYLLVITILTYSALAITVKNKIPNRLSKIVLIILYLNILGIPGGSGFTARFLLFRSLFRANIPLIYIVFSMLSLIPLVIFVTIEILRVSQSIPSFEKQRIEFVPLFLTVIVIGLGIYWEPFYNLILVSLR